MATSPEADRHRDLTRGEFGVRLAEIDRAVLGRPQLQVATDGRWEEAATAPLPLSQRGLDALLEDVDATEVGVEVLWPGPPIIFVGAQVGRMERSHLRTIVARSDWVPSCALEALAGGSLGPAVRAELGAVNAWQSVGPLAVGLDADGAEIERALAGRRDLACCDHPVALEIVHESRRRAWWAIEVSSRRTGSHEVRAQRVAQLLRSIVSPR